MEGFKKKETEVNNGRAYAVLNNITLHTKEVFCSSFCGNK